LARIGYSYLCQGRQLKFNNVVEDVKNCFFTLDSMAGIQMKTGNGCISPYN
jgi:hypothetical protein